jgi:dTDP-4-dehydrorhamnose 3,5-epimerase-like enzyme
MNNIKLINGGMASDDRGCLKFVNDFTFDKVKRFYQVKNHQAGYIRAWHGHINESKYVYVVKGAAIVGAVPLPKNDTEQSTPQVFYLTEYNPKILYIPEGYANGFKTLTDDTIVMFYSTSTLEESAKDDIRFEYDKWNIWKENYR